MSTAVRAQDSAPAVRQSAAVIALLCVALAQSERRAARAEGEAGALREQLVALESWLDDTNRVEHLQRGRLVALAAEERAARRRPLVASPAAVLLLVYCVAMIVLVYAALFARV